MKILLPLLNRAADVTQVLNGLHHLVTGWSLQTIQIARNSKTGQSQPSIKIDIYEPSFNKFNPISRYCMTALVYGIAHLTKATELPHLFASTTNRPLYLPGPISEIKTMHEAYNVCTANPGQSIDLKKLFMSLVNLPMFLAKSLTHDLNSIYKITLNPIMLDYFKNEILKNPNVAAFNEFVALHERLPSLQNLFQKGISLKMNFPTRHAISIAIIAEIYLCTSGLENMNAHLPLEIRDIVIAHFLQIPVDFLPYVKGQQSQDSGISKQ